MHGVFLFQDIHFVVAAPMTDDEVAVYKRSPETFFGVVQSVGQKADNVLDMSEFFYATYKNTPKDELLEFIRGHPDIERLRSMPQRELAIFVCEQWAIAASIKK